MNNNFLLLVGIGLIIFIIGIIVAIKEVNKGKKCTSCITGYVVDYEMHQDDSTIEPIIIVEYNVNGVFYTGKKTFRGMEIHTRRFSINGLNQHNYDIYIDDKDILHINRGSIINYKEAISKVCPVRTPYKVYYNPMKPQQSFVDRELCGSPVYGIIFMVIGFIFMIIGGVISFAVA